MKNLNEIEKPFCINAIIYRNPKWFFSLADECHVPDNVVTGFYFFEDTARSIILFSIELSSFVSSSICHFLFYRHIQTHISNSYTLGKENGIHYRSYPNNPKIFLFFPLNLGFLESTVIIILCVPCFLSPWYIRVKP